MDPTAKGLLRRVGSAVGFQAQFVENHPLLPTEIAFGNSGASDHSGRGDQRRKEILTPSQQVDRRRQIVRLGSNRHSQRLDGIRRGGALVGTVRQQLSAEMGQPRPLVAISRRPGPEGQAQAEGFLGRVAGDPDDHPIVQHLTLCGPGARQGLLQQARRQQGRWFQGGGGPAHNCRSAGKTAGHLRRRKHGAVARWTENGPGRANGPRDPLRSLPPGYGIGGAGGELFDPNDPGLGPGKEPAYRAGPLGKNAPRHPLQIGPGNGVDLLVHALQDPEAGNGFEGAQLMSQFADRAAVQTKSSFDLPPGPVQFAIGKIPILETLQLMVHHLLGQLKMGTPGKRHRQLIEVGVTGGLEAGVDMGGDLGIDQGPVQTRGSGGAFLQGFQTHAQPLGPAQDGVQDPQPVQIALVDTGGPKSHLKWGTLPGPVRRSLRSPRCSGSDSGTRGGAALRGMASKRRRTAPMALSA